MRSVCRKPWHYSRPRSWASSTNSLALGSSRSVARCLASTEKPLHAFPQDPNRSFANPPSRDERRLLGRARLHNISSEEHLLYESRIGHTHNIGSRLTDGPRHRQDLELWRLILDVNTHLSGLAGIQATWRGMKYRGLQVQLPDDNPSALEIWEAFVVAAASKDIAFLQRLCWNCIEKKMLGTKLFVDVVGNLLRYQPKHALKFASLLRFHGSQGREDLLAIFDVACESNAEGALQSFQDVRSLLPEVKLYPDLISRLSQRNRMEDALAMHDYLLSQQDLPKDFEDVASLVRHFATSGSELHPFLQGLRSVSISYEAQIRRLFAHERARLVGFHPETMNIVASHTFGREPMKLKDETVAKALASFSFNFVSKVGPPFGLIEVGPLSVRQMALASQNANELSAKFEQLRELDIDTGSSTYVRVMKKVAASRQFELMDLLMNTDMHHEEFEDTNLQTTLLGQNLKKGDLSQVNQSLAILNLGETNSRAREVSMNLVLRSAIINKDWKNVVEAVDIFRQDVIGAQRSVLNSLIWELIHPSKREMKWDQMGFLVGIMQQLLVSGAEIQPGHWVKPLLELGRLGRLDELENLLLWLVDFYVGTTSKGREPLAALPLDHGLTRLFTSTLTHGLISWSFSKYDWNASLSSGSKNPTPSQPEPWLRGAAFLKKLSGRSGVRMDVPSLQEAFVKRIQTLYKVEAPSRLMTNRVNATRYGVRPAMFLKSWSRLWRVEISPQDEMDVLEEVRRVVKHRRPSSPPPA